MSPSPVLTILLWCAAGVILPAQGRRSTRSDDESPLTAVVDALSRDVVTMKAQLQAQQNEIAILKAANTQVVAFSAYITHEPHVPAVKGSAAPFNGVISNVGGGYSPSSSAFSAPIPGQYFFIVSSDCTADFHVLEVTINGHRVFSAENDGRAASHVTGSGLVTLRQGDVVTTRYQTDSGYLDAGNESTFTGFRVK